MLAEVLKAGAGSLPPPPEIEVTSHLLERGHRLGRRSPFPPLPCGSARHFIAATSHEWPGFVQNLESSQAADDASRYTTGACHLLDTEVQDQRAVALTPIGDPDDCWWARPVRR